MNVSPIPSFDRRQGQQGHPARRWLFALLAIPSLLAACRPSPPPPPALPAGGPRLVLFVAVDQMRQDYLTRFDSLYTGGLRTLLDEAVSFDEAHHEHALTVTAPGHATLATGLYPRHHGVIDNSWYGADGKRVYCVADERHWRSPANLEGSTLGDWLKAVSPGSKVFGASAKDRAAILMAGHEADGAWWYDRDEGTFTSSTYYPDAEPPWLAAFTETALARGEFGKAWEPLPLPEGSPSLEELAIEDLDEGAFRLGFPHLAGGPTLVPNDAFHGALYSEPFVDLALARFAEALIAGEHLGEDEAPDLLALSFSATDTVGHEWGPNSPEVLDTLLRLDAALGELLAYVDRQIGLEHVLITLSSDHGVAPVPEYQQLHGLPGRRVTVDDGLCWQQAGLRLAAAFGGEFPVDAHDFIDPEVVTASGKSPEEIAATVRGALEACPGVVRVWTRSELAGETEPADPYGRLYYRSFDPERSPDYLVQYEEGYMPTPPEVMTTHGSPYRYDTHVPWLLRPPSARGTPVARHVSEPVATVDIAPTVATLLAVPVPKDRDGVDRSGLLRP